MFNIEYCEGNDKLINNCEYCVFLIIFMFNVERC